MTEMFTVYEVSNKLKITEELVRSSIRNKKIKAVKFGIKWMVSSNELERIMKEGF